MGWRQAKKWSVTGRGKNSIIFSEHAKIGKTIQEGSNDGKMVGSHYPRISADVIGLV